jgi:hypothetical protein
MKVQCAAAATPALLQERCLYGGWLLAMVLQGRKLGPQFSTLEDNS